MAATTGTSATTSLGGALAVEPGRVADGMAAAASQVATAVEPIPGARPAGGLVSAVVGAALTFGGGGGVAPGGMVDAPPRPAAVRGVAVQAVDLESATTAVTIRTPGGEITIPVPAGHAAPAPPAEVAAPTAPGRPVGDEPPTPAADTGTGSGSGTGDEPRLRLPSSIAGLPEVSDALGALPKSPGDAVPPPPAADTTAPPPAPADPAPVPVGPPSATDEPAPADLPPDPEGAPPAPVPSERAPG